MSPADTLISRLDGVQGRGPRYRAICPAHESKHRTRSLAVAEADDGRVLLRCFAGCEVHAIVGALGLQLEDLFPPRPQRDDQRTAKVKKPWTMREVVQALDLELGVAWIVLRDVAAGRPVSRGDRERAKVAADRCEALLQEIRS